MPASNVQKLKNKFKQCVLRQCKKSNCKFALHGFPSERVILDVDCIIKSGECGNRCDCIIVIDEGNDTFLLPIEFKSGSFHSARVKEQLEGGIEYFNKYISGTPRYYPVLVTKSMKKAEHIKLMQTKIEYAGNKNRILAVKCNQKLNWRDVIKPN